MFTQQLLASTSFWKTLISICNKSLFLTQEIVWSKLILMTRGTEEKFLWKSITLKKRLMKVVPTLSMDFFRTPIQIFLSILRLAIWTWILKNIKKFTKLNRPKPIQDVKWICQSALANQFKNFLLILTAMRTICLKWTMWM